MQPIHINFKRTLKITVFPRIGGNSQYKVISLTFEENPSKSLSLEASFVKDLPIDLLTGFTPKAAALLTAARAVSTRDIAVNLTIAVLLIQ